MILKKKLRSLWITDGLFSSPLFFSTFCMDIWSSKFDNRKMSLTQLERGNVAFAIWHAAAIVLQDFESALKLNTKFAIWTFMGAAVVHRSLIG